MEKVRELLITLQVGLSDFEETQRLLAGERLKYSRLLLTEFPRDTKEGWEEHLRGLEESLKTRERAIRQSVKRVAADLIQEEKRQQLTVKENESKEKEKVAQ